jgi:DNA-binding transcriptional regulator GbsR (MarR family)
VRYLVQLDLVRRERVPGSRRDLYRVHDDVWVQALERRNQAVARWEQSLREGIEVVGAATAAGARLADTLEFFSFVNRETAGFLQAWRERDRPHRRLR